MTVKLLLIRNQLKTKRFVDILLFSFPLFYVLITDFESYT